VLPGQRWELCGCERPELGTAVGVGMKLQDIPVTLGHASTLLDSKANSWTNVADCACDDVVSC
jgi:hypothetical protein